MRRARLTATDLDVGGLRMHVRAGGVSCTSDDPIVCIHGAVVSGRYMMPVAERLAAAHRVQVPDLPGYGRSGKPPRPLRVPELADAVAAFLDAARIDRCHLLGNSLGAQIAADVAARHADRVTSAILVGPTVDGTARSRMRQLWRLAIDALRERASLIPLHLSDVVRAGPRLAIASIDIALEDRIEEKLARVAAPVLIVSGTRDPLVPCRWSAHLAALTPNAELAIIEGPHALNYSRPEPLARLVTAFLARHRSGAE